MATETVESNQSGGEPSGAIAQLERHLKLLEKAFTEGVERHEKFLREKASALSSVEDNVLALCNRMEQSEQKQAGAMMELRSTLCDIGERLNGLEAGNEAGFVFPELPSDLPPLREAVPLDVGRDDISKLEPKMEQQSTETSTATTESYLSSARRAANEAAVPHKVEDARAAPKVGRRSSRMRLVLLGCAAPLVVVAVTAVMLNRHSVTAAPEISLSVPAASTGFVLPAPPQVVVAPPADPSPAVLASTAPVGELEKKAETGDAKMAREVGLKYLVGDGTTVDEAEAASWLLQASYKGDPTAEYWLGTLYAGGRGVPADVSQSNHWYEAAAKQGNRRAMHGLGVANFEGRGMDKNPEEAARWFTKAAELGFTESQFNLAVLYEQGTGVPTSLVQAYKWYAIAAGHGDQKANARVAELAKALKPAELDTARHDAAAFKPVPMDESANAMDGPAPSGG
jgi:localization factor PodJL